MLENVGFNGFSVKSSRYDIKDVTDKGLFNVVISDVTFDLTNDDESINRLITMSFDVEMQGFSDGIDPESEESEPAFEAAFSADAYFKDCNAEFLTKEFIESNVWFFYNFSEVITKITLDNIFKNSELGDMPIPWTSKGISPVE